MTYWLTIFACLLVLTYACYQCWRLSMKASILSQCIADMLHDPDRAEEIARECHTDLDERGLWLSG